MLQNVIIRIMIGPDSETNFKSQDKDKEEVKEDNQKVISNAFQITERKEITAEDVQIMESDNNDDRILKEHSF